MASPSSPPSSVLVEGEEEEDSLGRPRHVNLMAVLRRGARRDPARLAGEERRATAERLQRMLGPGKVVLLEGPAGAGKSVAVRQAVASLAPPVRVAEISGRDFSTPEQAFRALIVELGGTGHKRDAIEGRQFLTWRLGELKKEGVFTVVVLHDCELFVASLVRQSLLYALFDLTQDPDVNMVVILTTRTQDFVSSLEKRLESRLGTQRLVMPALTPQVAEEIILEVLTVRNADDPDAFVDWNAKLDALKHDLRAAVKLLHYVNCTNVRFFVNFAWILLSMEGDIEAAYHHVMYDVWRARMESMSEVELSVLVVMLRPSNSNATLAQAFQIYEREMRAQNFPTASKALFSRAWDNLLDVAPFSAFPEHVLRQVVEMDKWSTHFTKWAKEGELGRQ